MGGLIYVVVMLVIGVLFVWPAWITFRREEEEGRRLLAEAKLTGRNEPVTIRPWVDPERCMGSGVCVAVCPEGDVLQVIDGRATLVNAASCVGHGACEAACPVNAIELRFGSERRGVDIPAVSPTFASNVDGLFIAGELGGMGLIANAVKQGTQAVDNLRQDLPPKPDGGVDLIIVGAGPAGVAASMTAKNAGMEHIVLEQDGLGGSILHYPRKKLVMTHGMQLPKRPKIRAGSLSKEELVEILTKAVQEDDLPIRERECVNRIHKDEEGYLHVTTASSTYRTSRVLLAVGRRGTPRKLGVPGEELPKVAYRLLDPDQIHHEHILVVGGGDSALEAVCSLAESPGNRVSLSYRRDQLTRPKAKNLQRLETAVASGTVELQLGTQVKLIAPDRVTLLRGEQEEVIPNDRVFVFAGGVLPTKFLIDAGVKIERHFGNRIETMFDPDAPLSDGGSSA